MARKEASISLSLLPRVTSFTVPSSFSSTVTGKLPVRPLAVTVSPLTAVGAVGASTAGVSLLVSGSAAAKLFTASTMALLLVVASVTASIPSTGRVFPTN